MKKLLLLLLILSCAATAFLYDYIIKTPVAVSEDTLFMVQKGDSLNKIARTLKENKLIRNEFEFILYSKINKIYPKIKAGEYLVSENISLEQLADKLTSGKVYLRKITFPEGITATEVVNLLQNNEFLSQDETVEIQTPAEGSILPETYTFSRGDKPEKIISQAQKSLQDTLEQAWTERDDDLPLKTKEELLILASIVEKETGVGMERAQVASVFVNRLRLGMLLQTDPTVIYAVTQGKEELKRPLTRKDLEIDSRYNTYKYAGLPPTPICNPGKEAIFAAAHPAQTPYLYFVASGNGGHNFAKTLSEHNENVRKWRSLNK